MSEGLIFGTGEYADLALGADVRVYLCAENAARDAINVYSDARGQALIASLPGAWAGDRVYALYPRIAVNPFNQVAVAYQRGPAICLSLLGQEDIIRPDGEEPFGTEMVCVAWLPAFDRWRLAYIVRMFGVIRLVTRDYSAGGVEMGLSIVETDCTQGVSRILPDGRVLTMDEDNRWPEYPNLSRPTQVGSLILGQANDAPARVLGYVNAGSAYRIFDGLAYRPRAVQTATGWTVIASGVHGVRVVDVPPFVVDEPAPIELEPVTRPVFAGWFKVGDVFDPTQAWRSQPQSWCHVETVQAAREAIDNGQAVVCAVDVALAPGVNRARVAAIWCQGPAGAGADVNAVEVEYWRALSLLLEVGGPRPPVLAYVDDAAPVGFPPSADWHALQCYAWACEDASTAEARFRSQLARCPNKPIVLIAQAWDRRTTAAGQGQPLAKVEALQAVWPRLVNSDSRIIGVLAFAWGRAGGAVAYPSLADLQARIVRSIPSIPPIPRIDQPVDPPEEPPVSKPYDEQFYLNTAPPMKEGDPEGATAQAIADYAVMGRPVDGQYSIWFTRTEHDYQNAGLTLQASWKKHRNEMREVLNPAGDKLPPFP